jgi:hypothetical protein
MYLLEEEVEEGDTIRVSLVPGEALRVSLERNRDGVKEGFLQSA